MKKLEGKIGAGNRRGDHRAACGLGRVRTTGAPLAEVDWETVYGSGPRGYSDYPAIRRAAGE